jgi:hypothetical protein
MEDGLISTAARGIERRREPRIPIGLRVVEISGATTYFQYATNLSAGGLYLDGTLAHPPGTRVTLLLMLPGDSLPTSVPAEVVGPGPGARGVHLAFVDEPDSRLRRRLRELVAEKSAAHRAP